MIATAAGAGEGTGIATVAAAWCAGSAFVSAFATAFGLMSGGAFPSNLTVTEFVLGIRRKFCADFRSITTRVIAGLADRSEVRIPFTSPWRAATARSSSVWCAMRAESV